MKSPAIRNKSGTMKPIIFILGVFLAIYLFMVQYVIRFTGKGHEGCDGTISASTSISNIMKDAFIGGGQQSSIASDSIESETDPSPANKSDKRKNDHALDCSAMLRDFLDKKISEIEAIEGFEKSYVTRTSGNKQFYLATHDAKLDKVRATSFQKGRYYESDLTKVIQKAFDKKSGQEGEAIFLDVGGNIGWFSLLAKAHGASQAYVFEPNPANIVRICESLTLNGWKDSVDLMMMGVSDEVGTKALYKTSAKNPGSFSFDQRRANKYNHGAAEEVGEFQMITLDSFAEEMGWFETKTSIAFFKLDVEGFEPQIIKGAQKLFESGIVELFAMEMKRQKSVHSPEAKRMMTKVIIESGYELYMHGKYSGPKTIVEEKYGKKKWEELADDIIRGEKYGENLLFRRVVDREEQL
jgi:FkbM family methyltransferase